ncbi:NAD(P)-binding protein [Gymnopus androsaceus JB14]|uniref:NAD(P)-binding protein n=1 Tax=Gymnopus androsaceus JB14 TaxID=1447944 RepID=A0A6A4GWJ6_9AGAR|nr:NAD(P)-binding protein [Gymnopus androsaceus JB14]
MSSQHLVLVTGVSGFLASHVTIELLRKGFRVRGTARRARIESLRASKLAQIYPNLEFAQLDDIASSDLTEALQGVGSVVHVASPLPGKESAEVLINTAVAGTLNVLRQAKDAGIKNFVVTSSIVTMFPSLDNNGAFDGIPYTEDMLPTATREDALSQPDNAIRVYVASKQLAEQAAFKFVKESPGVKMAAINPPFLYGPSAPGFPPSTSASSLGTNGFVYSLLGGKFPPAILPTFCDVRDTAEAHVAALLAVHADTIKANQPQRFLVGAPFQWKEAVEYLDSDDAGLPEEIRKRLPSKEARDGLAPYPGPISVIDTTRAKQVLGIEKYIDWKTSVKDTILSLAEEEKGWVKA